MPVVGIDVAKQTFEAAWLVKGKWKSCSFTNSSEGYQKLLELLGEKHHICLEATGRYGNSLARTLFDAGHVVSVVNPLRVQRYAESRLRRTKTDRADAVLIAEFCDREQPRAWQPLSEEIEQLRELIRRREHVLGMKQMERNRSLAGPMSSEVDASISRSLAFWDNELDVIEKAIAKHLKAHAELEKQQKLLRTIPGIGPIAAAVLIAEIGDIATFDGPKNLAAYFGLNPKEHSSGTSVFKRTGIAKMGNPRVRRVLYMAAFAAKRHNPPLKEFVERTKGTKHSKLLHVAVMRKLVHQIFGVLKNQQPFNPRHHVRDEAGSS